MFSNKADWHGREGRRSARLYCPATPPQRSLAQNPQGDAGDSESSEYSRTPSTGVRLRPHRCWSHGLADSGLRLGLLEGPGEGFRTERQRWGGVRRGKGNWGRGAVQQELAPKSA